LARAAEWGLKCVPTIKRIKKGMILGKERGVPEESQIKHNKKQGGRKRGGAGN